MRLLALWMACLLPVPTMPLAAQPVPVRYLSATGVVWINSAALPSGSSIYNGDTVATADNGFALLHSPQQGRVEVRPDTLVSVAEREIALQGGVVASDGLAVRLGDDLLRPDGGAESRPWMVVADRGGRKLVAAYRGSVVIDRAGDDPLVIPEGYYAVPRGSAAEQTESTGLPQPKSTASGNGHWAVFSLTSSTAIVFIVSLGATAVFASVVAYSLGQDSVSPSN